MRGVGQNQISLIETREELESLARPWRELAARADATPFLWYEWHAAWLTTMGAQSGSRPFIVVVREGERLLAVMPLALRRTRHLRLLEWSAANVTDYCDALVDPGVDTRSTVAAMWQFIKARGGFDIVRLSNLRADASTAGLLDSSIAGPAEVNHYSLPITWNKSSAWLKSLSSKARQDIGRRMRRLSDSDVKFRICAAIDPWEPTLEALIEQKKAVSKDKGYKTFIDKPGAADFLRAVTKVLHERRVLQLSALRNRKSAVACHMGFSWRGVFYSYLTSYNPSQPGHSPGQTLLAQVVMWCCDNKMREIDFLTGGDDYKLHLGCKSQALKSVLSAKTLLGEAALVAYNLKRSHRKILRRPARSKNDIEVAGAPKLGEVTNVAATTWISLSAMIRALTP
jgi:CelD/BcsL family acetyltransferase involved in cellulose biosynthesis